MKEIELLTDLIHLLDKYDPETCASLARELSNPDFIPRLLDLLRILGNRPTVQTREGDYPTTETVQKMRDRLFRQSRTPGDQITFARHFQAREPSRPDKEESSPAYEREIARREAMEEEMYKANDAVTFAQHFQALKDYQIETTYKDAGPLPDDEQIIK